MSYWVAMFMSVIVASFSQILLKKSAQKKHKSLIREYLNIYVITGYALIVVSTLLTIYGYRRIPYKNGPIIDSLGYILIMVLSFLFFKEPFTIRKVIGNLLVLAGVIIFYT